MDFTSGLNLRTNPLQLANNESPEMINITIDPLGGIYTRVGWERWNATDIVDPAVVTWDPRRAFLHQLSNGLFVVYVANEGLIYEAEPDGVFALLAGVTCSATPHLADFAAWGDAVYIACGRTLQAARRNGVAAATLLAAAGAANWNPNYDAPVHGVFPRCETVEAHSGYMFCAHTLEDGVAHPNRIRWSHPSSQDDWAADDFLDIEIGGSAITGLMSFEDHLLIFKHDSMWALYGYDAASWQLVQKSTTVGASSPQAVTRSETVVFFYSSSDRGGIYAYSGERPIEVSEQVRRAFEDLTQPEMIWVGWLGRKLWVTLPWTYDGVQEETASVMVFDPTLGERGAWQYYSSGEGALGPLVGGSNVDTQLRPMGVMRGEDLPMVVLLDMIDEFAADRLWLNSSLGFTSIIDENGYLVTGADEEIIVEGQPGDVPFPTAFRTAWLHAEWPTRKKSWRRPDFVCRQTGSEHRIQVASFRDYDDSTIRRQHVLEVSASADTRWDEFVWDDGSLWAGAGPGTKIRRGSSFGLARAIQMRFSGLTEGARWAIDAMVLKYVLRRFR